MQLYYFSKQVFGARYYDPVLGIWLSPDAYREFHNPYGRSGDPVNFVDPDGNCEIVCIGIIVGAAVIGAYSGAAAANDDWNAFDGGWDNDWDTYQGAIVGGVLGAASGAALSIGLGAAGVGGIVTSAGSKAVGASFLNAGYIEGLSAAGAAAWIGGGALGFAALEAETIRQSRSDVEFSTQDMFGSWAAGSVVGAAGSGFVVHAGTTLMAQYAAGELTFGSIAYLGQAAYGSRLLIGSGIDLYNGTQNPDESLGGSLTLGAVGTTYDWTLGLFEQSNPVPDQAQPSNIQGSTTSLLREDIVDSKVSQTGIGEMLKNSPYRANQNFFMSY